MFALVKSNSFVFCFLCGFLLGLQVFDLPLFTCFSPWIFVLYSEADLAKGLQILNLFIFVVVVVFERELLHKDLYPNAFHVTFSQDR